MKTNYFRNIHTAFTQPQIIFRNINKCTCKIHSAILSETWIETG